MRRSKLRNLHKTAGQREPGGHADRIRVPIFFDGLFLRFDQVDFTQEYALYDRLRICSLDNICKYCETRHIKSNRCEPMNQPISIRSS